MTYRRAGRGWSGLGAQTWGKPPIAGDGVDEQHRRYFEAEVHPSMPHGPSSRVMYMSRHTIDRREFLTSGITIAGAGVLGASALACFNDQPTAPIADALDLPAPGAQLAKGDGDLPGTGVIASVGGVLNASILSPRRNPFAWLAES